VAGQNLTWVLGLGVLVLGVHLMSVALTKALRRYSRSRLEDLCLARGHVRRADDVAHHDEATEDAAEALAVLTGLGLASLLAALVSGAAPHQTGMLVIVSTLIVSVPGYFVAGAIGHVYAERVIDRFWPLARSLRLVTRPLGWARLLCEAVVAHLAQPGAGVRAPRPGTVEVEIPSDGDGTAVVDAELPESVRALIQQAIELTRRDVLELMTPRAAMVMLPSSVSSGTAAQTFRQTGLSRIPVFGESRDDILGILYAKDLFPRMTDPDGSEAISPRALLRPAHCVPETKNAHDLLEEFRTRRTQIAIVLDEYGSVAGLITLEDLLEELVGAIDDEHDVPSKADPLSPLGDMRYEVDATVDLEQLNQRLALRLPTDGDFFTVGGLAFHALGRVPEPGAQFQFSGVEFTVVEVVDHAIRRVRLDLQPRAAVGSS
jgi:CBS domain containing-hemolysin-like protein